MKTSVTLVTPKQAAAWLQRNDRNRKLSRAVVEGYKDSMRNGAWEQTGEAIKFSTSGRLIDGQHRLTALAELDGEVPSLPLLVVRDLDDEAQKKMDRGRNRRVSDELDMDGIPQARTVVSAIRYIRLIESGALFGTKNDERKIGNASEQDILEYLDANPGIVDFVGEYKTPVRKLHSQAGLLLGGMWLILGTGHERADEFVQKLITGSMLGTGNPVLTFRERLASLKEGRAKYADKELLYMLMRSWTGFRDGVVLSKIQLPRGGVAKENWINPND